MLGDVSSSSTSPPLSASLLLLLPSLSLRYSFHFLTLEYVSGWGCVLAVILLDSWKVITDSVVERFASITSWASSLRMNALVFVVFLLSFRSSNSVLDSFIGKAYVITTKASIPDSVRNVSMMCGFHPVHLAAELPYKEVYPTLQVYPRTRTASIRRVCPIFNIFFCHIHQDFTQSCFYTEPPGGKVPPTELTTAQLSLACTTKRAFELIAADPDSHDTDWSLILEDDVLINPSVFNVSTRANLKANRIDNSNFYRQSQEDPKTLILNGLAQYKHDNQTYGFVYLGICGGFSATLHSMFSSPYSPFWLTKLHFSSQEVARDPQD